MIEITIKNNGREQSYKTDTMIMVITAPEEKDTTMAMVMSNDAESIMSHAFSAVEAASQSLGITIDDMIDIIKKAKEEIEKGDNEDAKDDKDNN